MFVAKIPHSHKNKIRELRPQQILLSMEPQAATKRFKLLWRCLLLLPGFLAKDPSVTVVTSVANVKGDNGMMPGAVHRSPGICFMTEENPGKPQLGKRLMKGLCYQSSPQLGSIGQSDRTAHQEGKRQERRKGRAEFVIYIYMYIYIYIYVYIYIYIYIHIYIRERENYLQF